MQTDEINKKTKISEFFGSSSREKKMAVWQYVIHNILLIVHFGLAMEGYVPLWTFCVGAFIYVPGWMIALHELQHLYKPKEVNLFIYLNLLILTPFSLGFREMRDIHMRHHGYAATPEDPEFYHLRGSFFSGFFNVFFSPEQSVYYTIRDKGIDRDFLVGLSIRFVLFVGLVGSFGWTSLWYFIPVRFAYGACLFTFSYWLHREGGMFGTFQVAYPRFLEKLMIVLYGRTLLYSISHHDIHHDYPKIIGSRLAAARPYYTPKKSSLSNKNSKPAVMPFEAI